jgi:hypothetical protein
MDEYPVTPERVLRALGTVPERGGTRGAGPRGEPDDGADDGADGGPSAGQAGGS